MKKFMSEFKTFVMRGNVIDLAVGVIIGSAFTAIVNSVVNDLFMPLISLLTGNLDFKNWVLTIGIGNGATFNFGSFVSAIINFLLIAVVLFLVVKGINKFRALAPAKAKEAAPAPDTVTCPFCKSEISPEATRCPNCTSQLDVPDTADPEKK